MLEIDNLIEQLRLLPETLAETRNKSSTLILLKNQQDSLLKVLSSIDQNRKLLGVRKNLNSANEIIAGSLRGLELDEISRGDLLLEIKNLNSFVDKAEHELKESEDRKHRKSKFSKYNDEEEEMSVEQDAKDLNLAVVEQSMSAEWQKALKRVRNNLDKPIEPAEVDKDPDADKLKQKFATWDAQAKDAPSSMQGKAFGLAILPIIPLYEDFTVTLGNNLARLGIQHTIFEGYAVFEKQKVLYFSSKKVKELNKENQESQTNIQFAYDLVELINMRSSVKYAIVSDITKLSHKNNDIVMVWLMPEKVLNTLLNKQMSAGGKRGKSGNLRDWSFPFVRE